MQQSQLPPPLARVLEPSTGRACRLLPPPAPRLGHGFHKKHTEIRFSFASLFLGVQTVFQALPKWFPSLHSCLCPDLGQVQKTTLVPPCLSHLCGGVLRLCSLHPSALALPPPQVKHQRELFFG